VISKHWLICILLATACERSPLEIQLPDGSTPPARPLSCAQLEIPRCEQVTKIYEDCVDAAGASLCLDRQIETRQGLFGPPDRCTRCIRAAGPTRLCAQDPSDVPGGYPYLLVADCSQCAACAVGDVR
jgi:hypothetical protein